MKQPDVRLRQVSIDDAPFIQILTTDKEWLLNIGDRGVKDIPSAENFITQRIVPAYQTEGLGLMGISMGDTDTLVGLCGLLQRDHFEYPDLGFALLPDYRGQGIVQAAAQLTLSNPLAVRSSMILATALPSNMASIKTLTALGFDKVGIIDFQAQPLNLFLKYNHVEKNIAPQHN